MKLNGYDKRTPLNINLQKSFVTPSLIDTSPGSTIWFISGDGQIHSLSMPSSINDGQDLIVDNQWTGVQFPDSFESYNVRIKTGTTVPGASTDILSRTANETIDVKYKVFDPDFAILRPDSTFTFVNKDNYTHNLARGLGIETQSKDYNWQNGAASGSMAGTVSDASADS